MIAQTNTQAISLASVLTRQLGLASERASRAGLHGLPDDYKSFAAADIRHTLAEESLEPDPAILSEKIQTLRDFRQEPQQIVDEYLMNDQAPPAVASPPHPLRWQAAASVALASGFLGLSLEASARGWALLGLAALTLILNLTAVPSFLRRVRQQARAYGAYRRAQAQLLALDKEIQRTRLRLLSGKETRHLLEQRAERAEQVAFTFYQLHKTQAERAALLLRQNKEGEIYVQH